MTNIFIGLLFIFFNFHLTFNAIKIELIPDFVGYLLIGIGINELLKYSENFLKAKSLATTMVVISACIYVVDMFGGSYMLANSLLAVAISVATSILHYLTLNFIILGLQDFERGMNRNLETHILKSLNLGILVLSLVSLIALFIPFVAIVFAIVALVVNIIFIVSFNKTKNIYYCS